MTRAQFELYEFDEGFVGFTLLCVTKKLPEDYMVGKQSYFVDCSNEKEIPLFNSFWLFCHKKNKTLICMQKSRPNSDIQYVQLIAQMFRKKPVFLVKHLLYLDSFHHDSQDFKTGDPVVVKDTVLNSVKDLVENMSIKYDSSAYYDVRHRNDIAHIKAQLLNETEQPVENPDIDVKCEVKEEILDELESYSRIVNKRKHDK